MYCKYEKEENKFLKFFYPEEFIEFQSQRNISKSK